MVSSKSIGFGWVVWIVLLNGAACTAYFLMFPDSQQEPPKLQDRPGGEPSKVSPELLPPATTPKPPITTASATIPSASGDVATPKPKVDPPRAPGEPERPVTPPSKTPATPPLTPVTPPLTPVTPPAKHESALPEGVDWSTGGYLVLVAATRDSEAVFDELAKQIAAIKTRLADRLVGGDVFVVGGDRVWKWHDWLELMGRRIGMVKDVEFPMPFASVAKYRGEIQAKRTSAMKTLVLWQCPLSPADDEAAAKIGVIPNAKIVWTGLPASDQLDNTALEALFGKRGVCPNDRSIGALAKTVASLFEE